MRLKALLPVLTALFCAAAAGFSFAALVPRVRAVEALTLFASAFGAGASLTAALVHARRKKPG